MPSPLRTPGSLDEWMELDYYRRPRPLRRYRRWLVWLALLSSVAGVAATFWPDNRGVYQAAPLSSAHAMFNDQCALCHTEGFQTARRLWPGHTDLLSVTNESCARCHAGALHNEQQEHTPGCASCHQEHRGRAQLSHVANRHCTDCHADLHRKDGVPARFPKVVDFGHDHPDFAIWRDKEPVDPGHLHFNHQLHVRPQGVAGPDGRIVQLGCVSCHEPAEDRRYLRPVNYARHCASCHPLAVHVIDVGTAPDAMKAAERFRKESAPHQTPAEVRAALRDRLALLADDCPSLLSGAPYAPARVRPGRPVLEESPEISADKWVEKQLNVNERLLFEAVGGCAYCHVRKGPTSRPAAQPEFEPTSLPRRWFSHARFSHDKHQLLACTECHPATESRRTSDVLMPHIDLCRQCHNPRVGAKSNCVDCHSYHDRSRESGGTGGLTIGECVGGRIPTRP